METNLPKPFTMEFKLEQGLEILERTPRVLDTLLRNLSDGWTTHNEGGETWSPYDVLGHLIHGERKDWMERTYIILNEKEDKRFETFDRFAQFEESKGKTLPKLLDEFASLRAKNIAEIKRLKINEQHLGLTGIHPKFGEVTLRQLLATWAAHDLGHLNQITRVMAKQYKTEIGPWVEYMSVMNR